MECTKEPLDLRPPNRPFPRFRLYVDQIQAKPPAGNALRPIIRTELELIGQLRSSRRDFVLVAIS
jgi:hypothetical protein